MLWIGAAQGIIVRLLPAAVLAVLMLLAPVVKAQSPTEKLQAATIAVYQGKQICKWNEVPGFFGNDLEWGCKFVSQFTCSATVVGGEEGVGYVGLTAGHCFEWEHIDDYYVAEGLEDRPVLHKITLQKFEDDDQYDYAVFTFRSHHVYPMMEVDGGPVPAVGTKVVNVNFALGLVKQTVEGKVVSDTIAHPAIPQLADTKGRYLVTIPIGPGASGSAVMNADTGKIIGIVEAMFPGTQMPTVVMPTGKTLDNFIEDDTAGLKPEAKGPLPKPPAPPAPEKKKRKRWF